MLAPLFVSKHTISCSYWSSIALNDYIHQSWMNMSIALKHLNMTSKVKPDTDNILSGPGQYHWLPGGLYAETRLVFYLLQKELHFLLILISFLKTTLIGNKKNDLRIERREWVNFLPVDIFTLFYCTMKIGIGKIGEVSWELYLGFWIMAIFFRGPETWAFQLHFFWKLDDVCAVYERWRNSFE